MSAPVLDLTVLYRSHGHVVVRRARQILGSETDAHELAQDLFMSLLENPGSLAGVRSPAGWLYMAATTRALQWVRNRNNRTRLLDERMTASSPATAPAGADRFVAARQLLARMPEDLATAVVLFHMDEMTHDEIARVLGTSRRNVGLVLERAHAWIAEQAKQAEQTDQERPHVATE